MSMLGGCLCTCACVCLCVHYICLFVMHVYKYTYFQPFDLRTVYLSYTIPSLPPVPPAPNTPGVFSEFLNEKPALRVIWTQPQSELSTQYNVQYRMVNSTVWTALHTPTTAVFIEGLLGGTSYQVRVRAVSEIGNGSFTPIVTAKTVGGESAKVIHAIPISRQ